MIGNVFNDLKQKKTGFTLAEVLITLGVIGVVAAMTIPVLLKENQKKELSVGYLKAFSTIDNAWRMLIVDNAGSISNSEDLGGVYNSAEGNGNQSMQIATALSRQLKVVSIEGMDYPALIVPKLYGDEPLYNLNGEICDISGGSAACIVYDRTIAMSLASGMFLMISSHDARKSCDFAFNSGTPNNYSSMNSVGEGVCYSKVYVDVNGVKKPNTLGRDIFIISLTSKRAIHKCYGHMPSDPSCSNYNSATFSGCNPSVASNANADLCGLRIIREGGMNY